MRILIKLTLVIIVFLVVIVVSRYAYLYSTTERGVKTYQNEFVSFDYPANFSIESEKTFNTHEHINGSDMYGMTVVTFVDIETSQKIDFLTLKYLFLSKPPTIFERIKLFEEEFDSIKSFSGTSYFKEIKINDLPASYFKIKNPIGGSMWIDLRIYQDNYEHSIEIVSPNVTPLFDWYGLHLPLGYFFDVFSKSFKSELQKDID